MTTIFLLSRDLGKSEFQATTIIVFWLNNLLKLVTPAPTPKKKPTKSEKGRSGLIHPARRQA